MSMEVLLYVALVVISSLRGGSLRDLLRRFWFMPFGMALGAWLGTKVLLAAPPEPFLLVLALVLLFYLNLDRLGRGESATVQRLRAAFGSAALFAGMRVRDRIDAQTYRDWLRKALWVMVVLLILQFSRSVFAAEPLFSAIAQHQESAALQLVAQSDVNARDANGDTPLHRAVETGMRSLTRSLLAAGADPQARTKNGESALHLAALHPEPDFTDLLLAARADPRLQNADGESPLHWAALSGHIVVAQRLLARGADPRLRTRKGQSARDYARREGHGEIVRLLERADQ